MKPIYFPFTYVPDPVVDALAACFGQFVIYRPVMESFSERMQEWINRGVMTVRVPVTGNENELKSTVSGYQIWADLHGAGAGEKTATLRARMHKMPFFSEFSSTKIAADIRDKIHGNSSRRTPDAVLAARVFLYIAQEFDRQNHELVFNLHRYDQQEAEMIRQLKMEDDPIAGEFRLGPQNISDPFADYMISDRLESWTRILCQDPEDTGLFVTHSPAILEQLMAHTPAAAKVMHLDAIPLAQTRDGKLESWQERLVLSMVELVEYTSTDSSDISIAHLELPAAESTVSLSVYRVADESPREFFTRCTEIGRPVVNGANRKRTPKNTLLALVQGPLIN